jgi:hypothetical protein
MSKILLATDPLVLAKTEVEYDDGGKMTIRNAQDAEPIVERNKRWQNDDQGKGKTFRHVAHIPLVTWLDLEKSGIARDDKAFAKWLNDPDNRAFRVWRGRI